MTSEETYIGAIDEGTSSTRFMVCFIENTTELQFKINYIEIYLFFNM